jgi:hypothetical protein
MSCLEYLRGEKEIKVHKEEDKRLYINRHMEDEQDGTNYKKRESEQP